MRKKRIPFALASSLYEVPFSFYKRQGIKVLLLDLDNTLVPYTSSLPDERALLWRQRAKEEGLEVYILSNNTGKRVSDFAEKMDVKYASLMRKPFSGPLKRFLANHGYAPSACMMIGDQIMTDVTACNGANVRCILTEPLDSHEPPWTKFNRLFDKPKRKKIKRLGLAKSWEEIK